MLSKKQIGDRIKQARKIKAKELNGRYTQEMLANDIEISRSYLGDIESGRTYPTYEVLAKIKDACNVPLNFFEDEPTTETSDEEKFEENYNNGLLVYDLIKSLNKKGRIKDINNIDKNILDMLVSVLKEDIKVIQEKEDNPD